MAPLMIRLSREESSNERQQSLDFINSLRGQPRTSMIERISGLSDSMLSKIIKWGRIIPLSIAHLAADLAEIESDRRLEKKNWPKKAEEEKSRHEREERERHEREERERREREERERREREVKERLEREEKERQMKTDATAMRQAEAIATAKHLAEATAEEERKANVERQEKLSKIFQETILNPLKGFVEKAATVYKEHPQLFEKLQGIQKEFPQLFEGENIAILFVTNPELIEEIVNFFETEPTKSKSLVTSLDTITAVKSEKCTIEDIYNVIPQELCLQLAGMMPWDPIPPSFPIINDDDILRYHIKKASKSFVGWDMLVFVVKKALKKILGTPILPIPNATTVYLFVNWSEMLSLLTFKHYGDKFLSKDKIVAISLSLVAMLLQLLNRESPLSYLKTAYSGGVLAKDFVAKMPSDLKKLLVNAFFKNANEQTKGKIEDILSYNIITWNNVLGELTDIEDLSMGKTIDMLYTFRVGTTFVDYANHGTGMHLHSLSEYWTNYGPLPNNPEQMERLFNLFRIVSQDRFHEKYNLTIGKDVIRLKSATSYSLLLQNCKELYDELSFLIIAYQPQSYIIDSLYTLTPKINMKLISDISIRAKTLCLLEEVNTSSLIDIEKKLIDTIQQSSRFLIA